MQTIVQHDPTERVVVDSRGKFKWRYECKPTRYDLGNTHGAWESRLREWKAGVAGWVTPSDRRG